MKKKIITLGFSLVMFLSLTACSPSINSQSEIFGLKRSDIQAQMESIGTEISSIDQAAVDSYAQQFEDAYEQATGETKEQTKIYYDLFEDYKSSRSELGDFIGFGNLTIEKSGKTVTCTLFEDFTDRDANLVFVYKIVGKRMSLSAITVNPVYSMKEILAKAGLNVLMGMVVVFAVLILISLVIYGFRIIPYLEKKKRDKEKAAGPASNDTSKSVAEKTDASASDQLDPELVAVIIAAIKASGEEQTDSFVVQSIKRR